METATASRRRVRSFGDEHEVGLLERTGFMRIDPLTAFAAIALIVTSCVVLALTSKEVAEFDTGDPLGYVIRQGIYGFVGIALMLAVARFDYTRFRDLRVGIYSVMIISIGLVLVIGAAGGGADRWIDLPFFRFQPSELGKLLLIIALAGFVIDRTKRQSDTAHMLRILALGLFPGLLVFLQPDLGTGIVFGVITMTLLFVAGVSWKHFAALGATVLAGIAIALVVAPALGQPVLEGYQAQRLTAFLGECTDPDDPCHQTTQSLIAIGSGGKTGLGDDATQARSGFLPEGHTDFIFAVTAERWGFVGAAFVLSLFALLIWRALRIATLSKNIYGSLLAAGVAIVLLFQVFVNVGMTLGIAPVVGIPLPLMSYGGSSVLVTFLAIGILQSVYVQSQLASPSRVRSHAL